MPSASATHPRAPSGSPAASRKTAVSSSLRPSRWQVPTSRTCREAASRISSIRVWRWAGKEHERAVLELQEALRGLIDRASHEPPGGNLAPLGPLLHDEARGLEIQGLQLRIERGAQLPSRRRTDRAV